MKKQQKQDIVLNICQQMLANSPEASYIRLNGALSGTLRNCIAADLPFALDTFQRVYKELRGSWWFGDGAGSSMGEHFYTLACKCNHASAQQSFEQFAGRPGVLLENGTKQPERLHVGSEFTWNGYHLTVTSMRSDSLVACSYKDCRSNVSGLKVGAVIGYGPEFIITASKKDGAGYSLRAREAKKTEDDRIVSKRFTIKYSEITEYRQSAKKRLKLVLDKIALCSPAKDRESIQKEVTKQNFRHWELEEVTAAWNKRIASLSKQEREELEHQRNVPVIEAWRAGKNGAYLGVESILLRINGDRVECSNGNAVSRAAASRLLPILLDNRGKKEVLVQVNLDGHTVERIGSDGVQIGCTLVPWSEIDLIAPMLKSV